VNVWQTGISVAEMVEIYVDFLGVHHDGCMSSRGNLNWVVIFTEDLSSNCSVHKEAGVMNESGTVQMLNFSDIVVT